MRKKIYSLLLKKAKNCMEETSNRIGQVELKEMSEKNKKAILMSISKVVLLLSPIIIERLIINSPKLLMKKILMRGKNIHSPYGSFWLSITKFLFSEKNFNNIFVPIKSDWQEEYFEALSKKEIWKARWINVRYTYAFLAAMWMKSPIGDLIEFVIKIAKP